jgi:hypothetical protein
MKVNTLAYQLLFILTLSFVSSELLATQTASVDQQATEPAASEKEDIEVIGVVGERSLAFFRIEAQKAEFDFYDAFNDLSQEPDFKVICRREKRVGSNISNKVCYPQYLLNRMARETQDALYRGVAPPNMKTIEFAAKKEREESLLYVEKLVSKNPQLLKMLIDLNEKQLRYEQAKIKN